MSTVQEQNQINSNALNQSVTSTQNTSSSGIFDDMDDDDRGDTQETKVKREALMIDATIYVSFATFLEVKYGLVTILDLNLCPDMKTIVSSYVRSVTLEKKLDSEKRISDNVSEEEKDRIRQFSNYPEYVGQRNVITLTLEKVILVAARVFSGFKYSRDAMISSFHFTHSGEVYSLNLKELILKLQEEYVSVGKTMVVVEFAGGYDEDVANLFITKRYVQAKMVVPNHLVALRTMFKNKTLWSNSPYINETVMMLVANQLIDQGTNIPEPTVDPKIYAPAIKKFANRSAHGLEDILNLSYTKEEEHQAMANAVSFIFGSKELGTYYGLALAKVEERLEGQPLDNPLDTQIGDFSLGWYSVSLSKLDGASIKKQEYKRLLERKFAKDPAVFLYTAYPVSYMFINHPNGRTYSSAALLLQFLNILPKFYHFLTMIIQLHVGTREDLLKYSKTLCTYMAEKLVVQPNARKRMVAQFMSNVFYWIRSIDITDFPEVKAKYLPSRIIRDDGDDASDEGEFKATVGDMDFF